MNRRSVCCWLLVFLIVASGGATLAGDGVVALQTAEPSCPNDSTDRYVDCDNGTVTDNETGLVWLANANCLGQSNPAHAEQDWHAAMEFVAGLSDQSDAFCEAEGLTPEECDCNLSDNSSPGEWRLPSANEWQVMIQRAVDLGCTDPVFTDNTGNRCWGIQCFVHPAWECSFVHVQSDTYWSSLTRVDDPRYAWYANLANGTIYELHKDVYNYVWPVRGGQ